MNLTRQLLIHGAFAAIALWSMAWLAQWNAGASGLFTQVVAGSAGFLLGFALAHLAHEWCHYLGGLIGRAPITVKKAVSPLFFDVDLNNSSGAPFLAMSLGGPAGNLLFIILLWRFAPLDNLVYQAALAAALGSLVYVLVLEVPVSRHVLSGKTPLQSLTEHFGQGGPLFLRATAAGLATSAGLLLVL